MKVRASSFLLLVLLLSRSGYLETQAAGNGSGTAPGDSQCEIATGLSILDPTQAALAADGTLTLYCPGTGTDGRNGVYWEGDNSSSTTATKTGPCTIDISWEPAQVEGVSQSLSGPSGGPEGMEAWPIAFWTGTAGAEFATDSYVFYAGSDSVPVAGSSWWGSTGPGSSYPPAAPWDRMGEGLSNGYWVSSGINDENLYVSVSSDASTPGTWQPDGLCKDPGIVTVSIHSVPAGSAGTGTAPTPPISVPGSVQQALAQLQASAGQVETDASANYVVFAPSCFWITPQPQADLPPTVIDVMGPPSAQGLSLVYSYYLRVTPSEVVHWNFGDGVAQAVPASGSGGCYNHYYKQISGDGAIPAAGATVTASQDVDVTAFVGWVDASGAAQYQCVLPGGALGARPPTQAQAEAPTVDGGCTQTYANALVDAPVGPKPVYQIRAIPVA